MMLWKVCGCRHHCYVLCLMEDDVDGRCDQCRDETCGVLMRYRCFRHRMKVAMGARP